LNEQALLAHKPNPSEVHYVTDSDDLFSLSLTPLMKDVEWYSKPRCLDPLNIASWWLRYDSPANDMVASYCFRIHLKTPTPEKWQRAQIESNRLMNQLMALREILRTLSGMAARNLPHAEQVLATALAETRLARFMRPADIQVTILLPSAAETYRLLDEHLTVSRKELLRLILNHVIVGDLDLVPGQTATLSTASGVERQLSCRGDIPVIDGVEFNPVGFSIGRHWCYELSGTLPNAGRVARTIARRPRASQSDGSSTPLQNRSLPARNCLEPAQPLDKT
jgi:hypothetical protein